jgi:hypothetical protein
MSSIILLYGTGWRKITLNVDTNVDAARLEACATSE